MDYAVLGVLTLPPQFSYAPYIPPKRISSIATANQVVTQAANSCIVHGGFTLRWECNSCFATEFEAINALYDPASLAALTFVGYWGEEYEVFFNVMASPVVNSRLWDLSGSFQVVSVTTDLAPVCTP